MSRTKAVLMTAAALLIFASGVTVGQELERISNENTGWWWYANVSAETLGAALDEHDARLIDLEVSSVSPLRFTASMVRNSGSYASGWWWYFGIDSERLSELVDELSARVLDLEVYNVGGQLRYAVILVPNTGSQAKAWWWYSGVSFGTLSDLISRNNARLVDLEVTEVSGQRRYAAVMIRNTGADQAAWWWHVGVSVSDLSDALASHSGRLLDLERMPGGRYAAIILRPRGEAWWWYYGLTGSGVADRVEITGGRIVDIERYGQGGATRYAVVLTGNVDNAATTVGQMLASGTDGEFGYYLKRMGGPVISGFHEDQTFYPASTIKALLLLYTVSRLAGPLELDTSSATYYSVPAESCLDVHPPSHVSSLQTLRWLAQQMMRPSNNQATNTLMEYAGGGSAVAGRGLVNNYVHATLGLSLSTALNHKLGCGGPSNNPANSLTLSDIGTFYEQAITGGVLPPTLLAEFHDTMLNETNAFPAALRTVITSLGSDLDS